MLSDPGVFSPMFLHTKKQKKQKKLRMETDVAFCRLCVIITFLWWYKEQANRCLWPLLCHRCPRFVAMIKIHLCQYLVADIYLLCDRTAQAAWSCPHTSAALGSCSNLAHPGNSHGRSGPSSPKSTCLGFFSYRGVPRGILGYNSISGGRQHSLLTRDMPLGSPGQSP